jgi:SAM-dependent methyltransferase
MKIKFYQGHWFGIDLKKLSRQEGLLIDVVASEKLYHHVYKKLLKDDENPITAEWLKNKHNLSGWLCNFIHEKKLQQGSILSVGCGLGIVEQPLVEKGIKIDLQECQDISIQYFQKNYPDEFQKIKFIHSLDMKEIEDSSYDAIMAITSTYCLSDQVLLEFLHAVHRILRKKGIFIWYETVLNVNDIIQFLKNKLRGKKQEGVLWGWKRSKGSLISRALKNNFSYQENYCFDKNNKIIKPSTFFGLPINVDAAWQMMVFKKND